MYLPDFPVPQDSWGALLDALSPSQVGESPPPPWIVLGVLHITTRSGVDHWAKLCLVMDEEVGAFFAGPRERELDPYRGGNSQKLERALKDAYSLHLRQSEVKGEETQE